jgi:hypothetical protein
VGQVVVHQTHPLAELQRYLPKVVANIQAIRYLSNLFDGVGVKVKRA